MNCPVAAEPVTTGWGMVRKTTVGDAAESVGTADGGATDERAFAAAGAGDAAAPLMALAGAGV
jgi:hypothetical protein